MFRAILLYKLWLWAQTCGPYTQAVEVVFRGKGEGDETGRITVKFE